MNSFTLGNVPLKIVQKKKDMFNLYQFIIVDQVVYSLAIGACKTGLYLFVAFLSFMSIF